MEPLCPRSFVVTCFLLAACAVALDNGLALTPPMGWKTWNAFQGDIDDVRVRAQIDALVSKARMVDGVPTSLLDLGYANFGIDDNWQACKSGWQGSFHAQDGTPLLNHSRFPSIKDTVAYGHGHGLRMEWYTVNCICLDTYIIQRNTVDKNWTSRVYEKEVEFLLDSGFQGVKIDNCGDDQGIGFQLMMENLNRSQKAMQVENCNQGHGKGPPRGLPVDPDGWCGGNFFRTGGDIIADFGVTMGHLQETIPYQNLTAPISRPGCWAYPDMLEVGNLKSADSFTESRTHFGAWCIVSSPLYLSLDLTDQAKMDQVWEIISNTEAIAVNQAWFGHPGRLVFEQGDVQVWAKKLAAGSQAALVLNRGSAVANVTVPLKMLGDELAAGVTARDVWAKKDVPFTGMSAWSIVSLAAHDSRFMVFKPKVAENLVV